jgi:hypothetical protein
MRGGTLCNAEFTVLMRACLQLHSKILGILYFKLTRTIILMFSALWAQMEEEKNIPTSDFVCVHVQPY